MNPSILPLRSVPWLVASLTLCTSACTMVAPDPSFDSLMGRIVEADQAALVPGSVVIVRLEDLSRQDGHVDVLAEQRIEQPSHLPINFRLKYDGGVIDPDHRYVVTASVYSGTQKLYVTDIPQSVITAGQPDRIELVLEKISNRPTTFVSQ